jgi:glycerol-3-phosphate O-acyltransferase / dihydroxyacetone phosphate acyltransferase
MLARLVRSGILSLVRLFYPRIEVHGRHNLPVGQPMLLVANHPNSLLDPLVIMIGIGRHVSFLAKSTFFTNPIGRLLMNAFGAQPVYRQSDERPEGGPHSDRANRNEATFARCRALLQSGQPLALFPEGTTHSNTMMLPLRTGAARIALSAVAESGGQLGLRIVPIGLWYQHKSRFRSPALVVVGQPFGLAEYTARYANEPNEAVDALTEQIDLRLDRVVLQAENAELLRGIPTLAAWTAGHEPQTLEEQHARTAELLAAYQRLRVYDPARLLEIEQQARRYARILHTLGVDDPWGLELSAARRGRLLWLASIVLIGFVPALAGFALSYGPYRLAAPLTPLLMGDYEETMSTGKLIIGSILVALGWLAIAAIVGMLYGGLWALLLLVLAPPLAYIALRWGEIWREFREALAYTWLILRHRTLVQELVARRQVLAEQVAEALRIAEEARENEPRI